MVSPKKKRSVTGPILIQDSTPSMTSRRRSRRLASQEPEDFVPCSSATALGADDNEQVPGNRGSTAERKPKEVIGTEILMEKLREDSNLSPQSPVALRTRSRSRCSSIESNDAGIIGDTPKAVNVLVTPKNKLTNAVTPRWKKASHMPQLEEITEEQLKFKDNNNEEEKTETKKLPERKRKLLEDGNTPVKLHAESSTTEISQESRDSANGTDISKELVKHSSKMMENLWENTVKDAKKSPAKVLENSLTKSPKEPPPVQATETFPPNNVRVSPIRTRKSSLINSPGKSPVNFKEMFSKESDEERAVAKNPLSNDYLNQEIKLIIGANLEENELSAWPKLDDLFSLWLRWEEPNLFVDNLKRAYAFVNKVDPGVPAVSEELLETDIETIWQQIAYGNKKFHRYFSKRKHFLDVELPGEKEIEEKEGSTFSFTAGPEDENFDGNEESNTGLFNLAEDRVKKLEENLSGDKNDDDNYSDKSEDSEGSGISGASDNISKKHWKSTVDDQFFSLAEMEEYLDKQEKGQLDLDENLCEQFDVDGDHSQTDYHYADFYESQSNIDGRKELEISQSDDVNSTAKKRVTFADEIMGHMADESGDDSVDRNSYDDGQEQTVLLGQVDEEEDNETEFQRRQKKLKERITSIEQANLAPRTWDLSGEVRAIEREENTMLEKHMDFDQAAPCAPIITVDTTAVLESKIIQRIKDKAFDDVLRTEHRTENNTAYRAPVAEGDVVKKSLTEVYEEQYQETQHGVGIEEKTNEKHEEIKKLMASLFQKLDALSHFRYIPSEVRPEVRILNNMPSLQKEEVGPLASTDAVLLAPEEIRKHVSGQIKGDDEKTKTDRSRSRRKKKKWQHIKRQQSDSASKADETPAKKQKLMSQYSKNGSMKLTSASFFQRLQDKNTGEASVFSLSLT
uniref:U3 small nucleolar ribonucleoprotein protein MPP10 n=1 Tax=Setaria digitata TaxID=48799 RepID=A0A915PQX0_9BILA